VLGQKFRDAHGIVGQPKLRKQLAKVVNRFVHGVASSRWVDQKLCFLI
jgi:hypothetical protein